jgi:hypothetical protein
MNGIIQSTIALESATAALHLLLLSVTALRPCFIDTASSLSSSLSSPRLGALSIVPTLPAAAGTCLLSMLSPLYCLQCFLLFTAARAQRFDACFLSSARTSLSCSSRASVKFFKQAMLMHADLSSTARARARAQALALALTCQLAHVFPATEPLDTLSRCAQNIGIQTHIRTCTQPQARCRCTRISPPLRAKSG